MACNAGFGLIRHETDSRKSDPGPPDLLLLREPSARWTARMIHAEIKAAGGKLRDGSFTKKGRYLPGQDDYRRMLEAIELDAIRQCGFVPEYYLWRAGHTWKQQVTIMDQIARILWRGHRDSPFSDTMGSDAHNVRPPASRA